MNGERHLYEISQGIAVNQGGCFLARDRPPAPPVIAGVANFIDFSPTAQDSGPGTP